MTATTHMAPPAGVLDGLTAAGQSHVLAAWQDLDAAEREALVAQIEVCCATLIAILPLATMLCAGSWQTRGAA